MSKSVLVIEDDENLREIYRTALSARGYDVITTTHGAEGVHRARRGKPDLILLDIRMPVMDGWDALLYLRSLDETKGVPICAISAHLPTAEERERIGEMDFDCFLMKPIGPEQIVAEVERQIGPPGHQTPSGGG
jgi:two-component system, cell cycle response regulator DivK